ARSSPTSSGSRDAHAVDLDRRHRCEHGAADEIGLDDFDTQLAKLVDDVLRLESLRAAPCSVLHRSFLLSKKPALKAGDPFQSILLISTAISRAKALVRTRSRASSSLIRSAFRSICRSYRSRSIRCSVSMSSMVLRSRCTRAAGTAPPKT